MVKPSRNTISLYQSDGRRKYLTPSERVRFISIACTESRAELGTFALMLALTGCRISEALSLTPANIDAQQGLVIIRTLKRRSRLTMREVPLPTAFLERLEDVHALNDCPNECRLWRWSRGRAWFLIKLMLIAAMVEDGPHRTAKGLRHAFAIHALRSGVPITLVQRWLGHASLSTTSIYVQATGIEEREFASLMWNQPMLANRWFGFRPIINDLCERAEAVWRWVYARLFRSSDF